MHKELEEFALLKDATKRMNDASVPVNIAELGSGNSSDNTFKASPFGIGQLTGMFCKNISDTILIDLIVSYINIEIDQLTRVHFELITIKKQEYVCADSSRSFVGICKGMIFGQTECQRSRKVTDIAVLMIVMCLAGASTGRLKFAPVSNMSWLGWGV